MRRVPRRLVAYHLLQEPTRLRTTRHLCMALPALQKVVQTGSEIRGFLRIHNMGPYQEDAGAPSPFPASRLRSMRRVFTTSRPATFSGHSNCCCEGPWRRGVVEMGDGVSGGSPPFSASCWRDHPRHVAPGYLGDRHSDFSMVLRGDLARVSAAREHWRSTPQSIRTMTGQAFRVFSARSASARTRGQAPNPPTLLQT